MHNVPRIVLPSFGLLAVSVWTPIPKKKPETETDVDKKPDYFAPKLRNKEDKELITDIMAADILYDELNPSYHKEIVGRLLKHIEKREAEILWRLARITYEKMKIETKAEERANLREAAFSYIKAALDANEEIFAVNKWMAILLNEVSVAKGVKEQILQSVNVKKFMLRATELNPEDPTTMYLLGAWCFNVAEVPWYSRKAATAFLAEPPTCEFAEALQHFLKAEETKPRFYSMNLLMMAKTYLHLGDPESAFECLFKLHHMPARSIDDIDTKGEGERLMRSVRKKIGYSRITFEQPIISESSDDSP